MQMPPRVAASAPPSDVPPPNDVTAMLRPWQAFRMLETSCVDFGYRTRRGTCSGSAKDSAVEDLEAQISGREVDSMFDSPVSSPSMFSWLWL
jgi:hypothetical protein